MDIELELELIRKSCFEFVRESSLDLEVLLSVESLESRLLSLWPLVSFDLPFLPGNKTVINYYLSS